MPETRFEIIDGRVTEVPPADEAHGTRHSKVSALLEAYATPEYEVASDMLTRTSKNSDMAPDVSVFPAARDPETGGRQLEELAFEVVVTERLGHTAEKARALSERGVRRVFAIDVERKRALEWSPSKDAWAIMGSKASIDDRALVTPLPVRALVEAMRSDDAVAAALLAKRNPVIESELRGQFSRGHAEGHLEGKLEGKLELLVALLLARGVKLSKKDEKKIRAAKDEKLVETWFIRATTAGTIDEVLRK